MPTKSPPGSLVERKSATVYRIGRLGVLAVALAATGCAAPAATTPAASSVASSPSTSEAVTETPVPTLEATTEDATEAPAGAITVTITGLSFNPDQLTAPAGTVVFFIDTQQLNEDIHHNMTIAPEIGDLPLAKSAVLTHEHSVVFKVHDMEPGIYQFWCTFEGATWLAA